MPSVFPGVCFSAVLAVLIAGAEPPGPGVDHGLVLEEFDVDRDGDLPLLPVNLKGKQYLFDLNTGSSHTFCDVSLRPLLGPSRGMAEAQTSSGVTPVEVFDSPDARLGQLSLGRDSPVGLVDLDLLRQVSGREIHGIIGMDFLKQHIVRIDSDRGKVAFLRSAGANPGRPLHLSYNEGGLPCLDVTLPEWDRPEKFVIVSGMGGHGSGEMRTTLFETLCRWQKIRTLKEGLFATLSGTTTATWGRLEALSVGGFEHRGLMFSSPSEANVLDHGFLSRYVVTFDFPHDTVYLRPGARCHCLDELNRSGLAILRVGGRTVVHSVDQGSPAASAGIRAQDEILKVDGKAVNLSSLFLLRRLLCAENRTVRLVLRRGAEEIRISLVLGEEQRTSATSQD